MKSTMRISYAMLLLVLVAGSFMSEVTAARKSRASSKSRARNNKGKNRASASASSVSRGGRSRAVAISESEAYDVVKNDIKELYLAIEARTEKGEELEAAAEAEVEAKALALAAAFASAYVHVEVQGHGEACGDAAATAEAQAIAFAEAVAEVFVEVDNQIDSASADASAEALASGVAEALAEAYAEACTTEGFGEALKESLSLAIVKPVARAFVSAIAGVDGTGSGDAMATTDSESFIIETVRSSGDSHSAAEGISSAAAGGDSSSKTKQIYPCEGTFAPCCDTDALNAGFCTCKLGKGFGCFASINKKRSTHNTFFWEDNPIFSDHKCFCAV